MINTVKVEYEPWKTIVIHEVIQYDLNNLLMIQSMGVPPGGLGHRLLWANGVAFKHVGMPPSPKIVEETLNGIIHWVSVEWALMPKHTHVVDVGSKVRIPVVNVSANETLRGVAKWLKANMEVSK